MKPLQFIARKFANEHPAPNKAVAYKSKYQHVLNNANNFGDFNVNNNNKYNNNNNKYNNNNNNNNNNNFQLVLSRVLFPVNSPVKILKALLRSSF